VLSSLKSRAPHLAPWAQKSLGQPTVLLCTDQVIRSKQGVQQGDPLGPLLFAMGIQPVLEKVAETLSFAHRAHPDQGPPPYWHRWYFDDGTVVGTLPQLNEALTVCKQPSPQWVVLSRPPRPPSGDRALRPASPAFLLCAPQPDYSTSHGLPPLGSRSLAAHSTRPSCPPSSSRNSPTLSLTSRRFAPLSAASPAGVNPSMEACATQEVRGSASGPASRSWWRLRQPLKDGGQPGG
jgi:hypothetical protein